VDLLLVLLVVVAPVYLGAICLLTLGLCRAAKRGDELEITRRQAPAPATRAHAPQREAAPVLLSSRR
jgi:hypothetical protein